MKLAIYLVIVLLSSLSPRKANDSGNEKFKFIKEVDGVKISSRWITSSSNRETREIKAEFYVTANPEVVLSLIKDADLAKKWMKSLSEFSVLKHESENTWVAYIQYNIPWPLNNQDCIIRYNCIKGNDGNHFELKLTGVPSYVPTRTGVERITHLSGRWKVTSGPDSNYKVEYTVYSEQKPVFPRWITDPIIQNNLIDNMIRLEKSLKPHILKVKV
jgi:hypothetical protein